MGQHDDLTSGVGADERTTRVSAGGRHASGGQPPASASAINYYADEDDDTGHGGEISANPRSSGEGSDYYDELARQRQPRPWTAGADLGLLILRLALGALFLAHGSQKLFGVLGGPGSVGFARTLEGMGFQQAGTLALVTGGTELASGALLVLGLFTPLAAAGIVGLMANAVFLHLGRGFFQSGGGFEFEAVLGVVALGLMFTGAGRVAVDNGRWWFRRPLTAGFISLVIAAGAAAGVLVGLHG